MIGDFNDSDDFSESDSNSSSSSSSVTFRDYTCTYSSDEELPYSPITASDTDIDTINLTESDTEIESTNTIQLDNTVDSLHISENMSTQSVSANDPAPVLDVSNDSVTSPSYYKLVGDNVDLTVNPRYMRIDNKLSSLHYYHSCAVQDRINVHDLLNERPSQTSVSVQEKAKSLLPTESDDDVIVKNILQESYSTLFSSLKLHLKIS